MDGIQEAKRLRDAIQDLLFYRDPHVPRMVGDAVEAAYRALAALPSSMVETIEAIDGANWRTRLRMTLVRYQRSGSSKDAQRLAEIQDQLLAVRVDPQPPVTEQIAEGPQTSKLVNMPRRVLSKALGLSDDALQTKIRLGQIRLHGEHVPRAKRVTLDVSQFTENDRNAILKKAALE